MTQGFWGGVVVIFSVLACISIILVNTGLGTFGTAIVITAYVGLWLIAGKYFENPSVRQWATRGLVLLGLCAVAPIIWFTMPDDVRDGIKLFVGIQTSNPTAFTDTQKKKICDQEMADSLQKYRGAKDDPAALKKLIPSGTTLIAGENPALVVLNEIARAQEKCLGPLRVPVSLPKTRPWQWVLYASMILGSIIFMSVGNKSMKAGGGALLGIAIIMTGYQLIVGDWAWGVNSGFSLSKFFPTGGLVWWWLIAGLFLGGIGLLFAKKGFVKAFGGAMIVLSVLLFGQWVGTETPKPKEGLQPRPAAVAPAVGYQTPWEQITLPPRSQPPITFAQYANGWKWDLRPAVVDSGRVDYVDATLVGGVLHAKDGVLKIRSKDERSFLAHIQWTRVR